MRLARLLLALYPPGLRREHGEEMEALLAARLRAARGPGAVTGLVAHTIADAGRTWWGGGPAGHGNGRSGMGGWMQDAGYALRRLRATPLFTLGAAAIIAVAIGANTAMFALVRAALWERPPYADVERLVHVYQDSDEGEPSSNSFPAYEDMRAVDEVFASVGATSPDRATLALGSETRELAVEYATSTLLPTLGLAPYRGRWFDASMDEVGAGLYGVIGHGTWQRLFGADPGIVGRTVELNGQPVEIIGVAPERFHGFVPFAPTDVWLSISSTPVGGDFRVANLDRRQDHWYYATARLQEDVSVARAQEAMNGLALRLAEAFPELNRGRDITVFPVSEVRVHPAEDGQLRALAAASMGVAVLVLLLAATNLASLLLARGMTRRSEIAVRRALGAGEARVASLFLWEGLLLSAFGGALGLLLASRLVALMSTMPSPGGAGGRFQVTLEPGVVLFALALVAGTGLFFGWLPALQSVRVELARAIRRDTGVATGRQGSLLRDGMIAVQVAFSVVLVVGATMTARMLVRQLRADAGVDVERLAILSTTFSDAGIGADAREAALLDLLARVEALPGVSSVALTTRLPISGGGSTTTVVEGYEPPAGTGALELPFAYVSPGYFETVGMRVLAGRGYGPDDAVGEDRSVIVNEAAARRFWGDPDAALGGRIRPQSAPDGWIPVVGVVSDAAVDRPGGPALPMIFYPLTGTLDAPTLLARADVAPGSLLPALRSALAEVHPRLPADRLDTMEGHISAALAGPRLATGVLGLFSALALLLASIGMYTIVSLTVAGRRTEIGLRMALGAARGRLIRLVTARALATVVAGVALGGALVAWVAPLVEGVDPGARLLDPGTLAVGALVMGVTAVAASWLPARRATRVDPVEALTRR